MKFAAMKFAAMKFAVLKCAAPEHADKTKKQPQLPF
jgi:hypothetical protein